MNLEHGDRFGKLTVIRKAESKAKRGPRYICGCACGFSPVIVKGSYLKSGRVSACLKCAASANRRDRNV